MRKVVVEESPASSIGTDTAAKGNRTAIAAVLGTDIVAVRDADW